MIQAVYLLSEYDGNGIRIGHDEDWNYLWSGVCQTDKKHMERCKFTIDKYNFNLIHGNIQSPYNE